MGNKLELDGWKLRTKIILLVVVTLISMTLLVKIPEFIYKWEETEKQEISITERQIEMKLKELWKELDLIYNLGEQINNSEIHNELEINKETSEVTNAIGKINYAENRNTWVQKLENGSPVMVSHPEIETGELLTDMKYNVAVEFDPQNDSLFNLINDEDYQKNVENKTAANLYELAGKLANKDGFTYILYMWPRPDSSKPVPKISAVRKLDYQGFENENMVLGTGLYLNNTISEIESYTDNLVDFFQSDIIISSISTIIMAFLIGFLIIWYSNKVINRPIESIINITREAAEGNYNNRIDFKSKDELGLISKSINYLLDKLVVNLNKKNKIERLQKSRLKINTIIQENKELELLTKALIKELTQEVNGQIGALYLGDTEKEDEEKYYKLYSSYAYVIRKGIKNSFKKGEGLIGQAALEKELIILENIPEDYIYINSGLGKTTPKNVVIVPCVYNDETVAILEIAFVNEINSFAVNLLKKVSSNIAISIKALQEKKERKLILETTREQAEELKTQQEELRTSNEELEEQTKILKESQTELETQQEELEVVNEELERKSEMMKIANRKVENQNKELEKAGKIIKKKVEDLEKSNKYKSEFLANMSHELRTPLNSILILSELLEKNKKNNLSPKEIEFAKTINSSGTDLLNLINDILDLSKVEAGKTELEIKELEIQELITELKRKFEPVADKDDLEFIIDVDEDIPSHIVTDGQKVKQIINNLLSNAFKFTKEGIVKLNISCINNILKIKVIDTGEGIEKGKQDKIFEAFKQEDGSINRKFGGTGLGLSISKELSKLLGGNLKVKSQKGKGSTFILTIPISYQEEYTEKENNEIKDKNAENNIRKESDEKKYINEELFNKVDEVEYIPDDRENLKQGESPILIVDDDSDFAEVMLNLVHEEGHKAIVAETGELALYYADYYQPSGMILDIGLPGIDGYQVIEKLNNNNRTKDIPLYVVSGRDQEKRDEFKNIIKYFKKPVSSDQVEEILNNLEREANKKERILVVEDNKGQRKSIVELIKNSYENVLIDSCSSAKDALEYMTNNSYNLLIIDLGLGDYSGKELIDSLKKINKNKDIPIVVYTGKNISKETEIKLRKQVEDIIIKGDKSSERLLDEVKIFLNKLKKSNFIDNNESFKGKTVLIVDDDMRNLFALSSILENADIKVEIATNGKEGINKLETNKDIDLVLMDIMMPGMDGYETIRQIRKRDSLEDISIIALTAKAMMGDRKKCINAGADEYLSKPVDRHKLLSLLRVWL